MTDDIQHRLKHAVSLHNSGNLDEAETIYRDVLNRDPRNFNARRLLGLAHAARGRLDDALHSLATALEIQDDNSVIHREMDMVLGLAGASALDLCRRLIDASDAKKAEILVRKALDRDPANHDALLLLGDLVGEKSGAALQSPFPASTALHVAMASAARRPFQSDGETILLQKEGAPPIKLDYNVNNTQYQQLTAYKGQGFIEPDLPILIDALMEPDDVFVDIGANWGLYTIFAATRPNARGKAFAFELSPETFGEFTAMIAQAGLASSVESFNCGVSNRTGAATFFDCGHSGLSRLDMDTDFLADFQWKERKEAARLCRLDDVVFPSGPDFIKIDVEGHELPVLEGASRTISKSRPFIFMENWRDRAAPRKSIAPLQLLNADGYDVYIPAWRFFSCASGSVVTTSDYAHARGRDAAFLLVKIAPEERLSFQHSANVFCCPRERRLEFLEKTVFRGSP